MKKQIFVCYFIYRTYQTIMEKIMGKEKYKVDDLKKKLNELDIKYTSSSKKADLKKKIREHFQLPEEDVQEKKYTKKAIPKALRIKVWDKDCGADSRKGKCYCCESEISLESFECGHDIAESLGGETSIDNLFAICSLCNKSMGTQTMDEFKKKLKSKKKETNNDSPKKEQDTIVNDQVNSSKKEPDNIVDKQDISSMDEPVSEQVSKSIYSYDFATIREACEQIYSPVSFGNEKKLDKELVELATKELVRLRNIIKSLVYPQKQMIASALYPIMTILGIQMLSNTPYQDFNSTFYQMEKYLIYARASGKWKENNILDIAKPMFYE